MVTVALGHILTLPGGTRHQIDVAGWNFEERWLDPASRVVVADLQGLHGQVDEGWPAPSPFGRAFPRIRERPGQHLEPSFLEGPVRAIHVIVAGEKYLAARHASEQLRHIERVLMRASRPGLDLDRAPRHT